MIDQMRMGYCERGLVAWAKERFRCVGREAALLVNITASSGGFSGMIRFDTKMLGLLHFGGL
jgi:hypothetical protein